MTKKSFHVNLLKIIMSTKAMAPNDKKVNHFESSHCSNQISKSISDSHSHNVRKLITHV